MRVLKYTKTLAKFLCFTLFFLYSVLTVRKYTIKSPTWSERIKISSMKYILLWTNPKTSPLNFLQTENSAFLDNNCEFTNCYVTDKRDYFNDIKLFDAIVFNGKDLYDTTLPETRSPNQKYVFTNDESSEYFPVCSIKFDNFFNWTWTYRLDSDVAWTYFNVYNNAGVVIAPRKTVRVEDWIKTGYENNGISKELKEKLDIKTKPVAWFVSHCRTISRREDYVTELRSALTRYNLDVDIYGECGDLKCPLNKYTECNEMLAKDYFFSLSFENSMDNDYVTEKVLTPLMYDTVPVVLGGANYTRFLPPGSYLNAMNLSPEKMAETMHKIITDATKQSYYDFFKWRKYYRINVSGPTKLCEICALMNNKDKFNVHSSIDNLMQWWNPILDDGDVCAIINFLYYNH